MIDWIAIFSNAAQELISPTTAAYALAALGLAIHFGYTGLLNFGQAGFIALGAYGYAISTLSFGFPVWASVLVGVGASIIFALILGIPTLRLRADYLAIVTIAAAEILRLIFTTNTFDALTGSASGLQGYKDSFAALNPIPPGTYGFGPFTYNAYDWWIRIVGWTLVVIFALITWLIMRSPWGRVIKPEAWTALTDSMGVPDRLRVSGQGGGLEGAFNTVVFDGVEGLPPRAGVTAIYVYGHPRQWPRIDPEISIVQPFALGDKITVETGRTRVELTLVTIASETSFIGRPRAGDAHQMA